MKIGERRWVSVRSRAQLVCILVLGIYLVISLVRRGSQYSVKRTVGKIIDEKTQLEEKMNYKKIGMGVEKLGLDATLREQLSFHFPYDELKPISNKIWQTWKVDISDDKFPRNFKTFATSWSRENPKFNHLVIPDSIADELIAHLYQQVPQVLDLYRMLPKNILKADFFRYLILFARGGTYSDIDTVALKPIDTWISFNKTINGVPNNAGLVLGIEADPDRPDWADWYARRIQFCQWTIQAKMGHPLLRELIIAITNITIRKDKEGFLNKIEGKDAGGDIMNWTGPGIFTDIIFKYINNVHTNAKQQNVIDWKYFTGLTEPRLVDDILVLPITSFSPGVGQMGAQNEDHPLLYVKHQFEGSWKPESERHIGH